MENIRNKIITISGEPASGKSTVVKEIKSKYEKQGFTFLGSKRGSSLLFP